MSQRDLEALISQKCLKLQFEDAELLAEYLCGTTVSTTNSCWLIWGHVLTMQSKYAAAIPILAKCSSRNARYYLAYCLYERGRLVEALSMASEILNNASLEFSGLHRQSSIFAVPIEDADVWRLLGLIQRASGNLKEAKIAYQAAHQADSSMLHCSLQLNSLDCVERVAVDENRLAVITNAPRSPQNGNPKRRMKYSSLRSGTTSDWPSADDSDFFPDLLKRMDGSCSDVTEATCYCKAARAYGLYEQEDFEKVRKQM